MTNLNCPRHGTALEHTRRHDIDVDRCPTGDGIWLDHNELEILEEHAADDSLVKGQMRYGQHESEFECPHCGNNMVRFRYRAYNLEVDECPDQAGFWLDKGEDAKILNIIKQRASNLNRSKAAEKVWHNVRRSGRGKSFIDRLKGIFRA